jgi:hypothetical protein
LNSSEKDIKNFLCEENGSFPNVALLLERHQDIPSFLLIPMKLDSLWDKCSLRCQGQGFVFPGAESESVDGLCAGVTSSMMS